MELDFYRNFRAACYRKDTTITAVLRKIGKATGSTGSWKQGNPPALDTVIMIADELGITLDELCYGEDKVSPRVLKSYLTKEQREWLDILDRIPEDSRRLYMDFLRTHAAVGAEKYADEKDA